MTLEAVSCVFCDDLEDYYKVWFLKSCGGQ